MLRCGCFAAPTAMFDMRCITSPKHKFMHIGIVVAAVCTEMLALRWSADHHCQDHPDHRAFIMLIRARNTDRQWRAALVHQDMDFAPTFSAIGRILARFLATQRCSTRAAIHRLPLPLHAPRPRIEAHQHLHDLGKATLLLPGLKALMQHATTNAKPVAMDGFPLAAGPQHIPNAIEDGPCIGGRTAWFPLHGRFGQQGLDFAPQRTRDAKIVNGSRFCGSMCSHDVSFLSLSGSTSIVRKIRRFVHLRSIYG